MLIIPLSSNLIMLTSSRLLLSVLAGAGVSATASDNSWTLTEDVAGSLSVVVEDEDFGSSQNQERINITTMSSYPTGELHNYSTVRD